MTNFSTLKNILFMASIMQTVARKWFYKRRLHWRTSALQGRPHVKGVVSRVRTMSPKKPNSASRHIAKVKLTSRTPVTTRLPGIGYLCARYNRVLVRGGRANDLPGVGYSSIRGVYDFSPVLFKKKRRSIYGVERPAGFSKHIRRKDRAIRGN